MTLAHQGSPDVSNDSPSERKNRTIQRYALVALAAVSLGVTACTAATDGDEPVGQSESAWTAPTEFAVASFDPAPPGWPHTIQSGRLVDCATEPAPSEVLVASDSNFRGRCAILTPGFYPNPGNLVVGNDAISSIKVGSAVRARGFASPQFADRWWIYPPGTRSGAIIPNDVLSSFRIEPANRSALCDDLREGEIALFEDSYFYGDCVVLPANESYASPENMGIENDSISSIRNNSALKLVAFYDFGFSKAGIEIPPHTNKATLTGDGWFTNGINDSISSVAMVSP